jgi:hypothetical protein
MNYVNGSNFTALNDLTNINCNSINGVDASYYDDTASIQTQINTLDNKIDIVNASLSGRIPSLNNVALLNVSNNFSQEQILSNGLRMDDAGIYLRGLVGVAGPIDNNHGLKYDGVDVDVDEKHLDEIETILTGTIEFRCFHFSTSNNHIDKLSFFMNRRARTPRLRPCSTLCA